MREIEAARIIFFEIFSHDDFLKNPFRFFPVYLPNGLAN